jgi:hypothetical protein
MFRDLIDSYRKQAAQYLDDARELASGRWRVGNQYGDQSEATAEERRSLAARLFGLADAYEDLESR